MNYSFDGGRRDLGDIFVAGGEFGGMAGTFFGTRRMDIIIFFFRFLGLFDGRFRADRSVGRDYTVAFDGFTGWFD